MTNNSRVAIVDHREKEGGKIIVVHGSARFAVLCWTQADLDQFTIKTPGQV